MSIRLTPTLSLLEACKVYLAQVALHIVPVGVPPAIPEPLKGSEDLENITFNCLEEQLVWEGGLGGLDR